MGLIAPFFIWLIFIKKTEMWISNIVIDKILKEDLTSGKYNPLNPYNQLSRDSDVDPTRITKNLGGEDAGSAKARSEYLREKIQDNFSKIGIPSYELGTYMKKQGIYSRTVLSKYTKPFDFEFTTKDGQKISGQALYNKKLSEQFKTIVLDFKPKQEEGEEVEPPTQQIKFVDEKELKRPFLGSKFGVEKIDLLQKYKESFALEGLQINGIFTVEISGSESTEKNNTEEDGGKPDDGEKSKEKQNDEVKKGNFYKGKDLDEVNGKLSEIKEKSKFFTIIKNYLDDPDFQRMFLGVIISETDSIKLNGKPILVTLKELKNYGLLDEKIKKKGKNRKLIKFKTNLQNFMSDVFSLFAKVSKNGKESETYSVIKKFYVRLYSIALKGQNNVSEQERKNLLKKLTLTFSVFLKTISKLPEMTKGSGGGTQKGKEIKVKNVPKATSSTVEYYINKISNSILNEEDGGGDKKIEEKTNTTKIKINKIGIFADLEEGLEDGNVLNKIENEYVKCVVDLKFDDENDDSIFNKSIKKEIEDGLRRGDFYVRMTQKPKILLIFSKTNKKDNSGAFFTIKGNSIKSKRDPKQWKGPVEIGNKAMGAKDFNGSKATISSFKLLNK
jgi:hypothetical protein